MSLTLATQLARENPVVGLSKHGAVFVTSSGDTFLGVNSRKTHPLQKKFGKNDQAVCLHAEVDAIRACVSLGGNPYGGVLYVARVTRNGEVANSKPCDGCQKAIIHFGLKDCVWTM